MTTRHLTLIFLLLTTPPAFARSVVYQEPVDFINGVFGQTPPAPRILWLTKAMRPDIEDILGHGPGVLRIRYWARDKRSAWVLDEIGKEKPITIGIVVNAGKIEKIRVLVFREKRGAEIHYPFFTDQFENAGLLGNKRLDRDIDGISGATLSVRAMSKLARLALYFHQHVSSDATP